MTCDGLKNLETSILIKGEGEVLMVSKPIKKGWFSDNTFVTEVEMDNYVSFFVWGYKEGREEVACELLIDILGNKFGELSDEYCSRLKKLDWIRLDVLLNEVYSFEGIEDINNYFRFDDYYGTILRSKRL